MNSKTKCRLFLSLIITINLLSILSAQSSLVQQIDSLVYYSEIKSTKKIELITTPIIEDNSSSDMDKAIANYFLGEVYFFLKKKEISQSNIQKAIAVYNQSTPQDSIAKTYHIQTYLLSSWWNEWYRNLDAAEKDVEKVFELVEQYFGESHPLLIDAMESKVKILQRSKKYQEALSLIDETIEKTKEFPVSSNYRAKKDLFFDKCFNYNFLGRYNDLNESASQMADFIEKNNPTDDEGLIRAYNSLGVNAFKKKDHAKSAYFIEKAREKISPDNSFDLQRNYNNLGVIYMYTKDYKKSAECLQKSYELTLEIYGEGHFNVGRAWFNKAMLLIQQDKYEEGYELMKKSYENRIKSLGRNHFDVAHTMQILGVCQFELGDTLKAIDTSKEALELGEELYKEVPWEENVRSAVNVAKYLLKKGESESARIYIDKAYKNLDYDYERDQLKYTHLNAPFLLLDVLFLEQNYLFNKYKATKDREFLQQEQKIYNRLEDLMQYLKIVFVDQDSRTQIVEKGHEMYGGHIQSLAALYRETNQENYLEAIFNTIELSHNTFLFEAELDERLVADGIIPNEVLQEQKAIQDSIEEKRMYLSAIGVKSPNYQTALNEFNRWKEKYYEQVNLIEEKHPAYFELKYQPAAYPLADIQKQLADNTILINFFVGNENLYVLKSTATKNEILTLASVDKINTQIKDLVENLKSNPTDESLTTLIEKLSTQFISKLGIETYENIEIVPDELLAYLPFEMLQLNGTPLVEQKNIWYHYSTKDLLRASSKKNNSKALVIAPHFETDQILALNEIDIDDENLRDELGTLNGSIKEMRAIQDIFSTYTLESANASENVFKEICSDYSLIHFATHGLVSDKYPQFSKLVFNESKDSLQDGYLHAYEIYSLPLNADLVTLGACNTGVGAIQKGEGINSIGRAFAYAGCPNTVQSLWSVNDASTAELMKLFYTNLKAGQSKPTALTNAKRAFVQTAPAKWKHPFYWAGFVYYGDANPLDINRSNNYNWWLFAAIGLLGLLIFYFRKK